MDPVVSAPPEDAPAVLSGGDHVGPGGAEHSVAAAAAAGASERVGRPDEVDRGRRVLQRVVCDEGGARVAAVRHGHRERVGPLLLAREAREGGRPHRGDRAVVDEPILTAGGLPDGELKVVVEAATAIAGRFRAQPLGDGDRSVARGVVLHDHLSVSRVTRRHPRGAQDGLAVARGRGLEDAICIGDRIRRRGRSAAGDREDQRGGRDRDQPDADRRARNAWVAVAHLRTPCPRRPARSPRCRSSRCRRGRWPSSRGSTASSRCRPRSSHQLRLSRG